MNEKLRDIPRQENVIITVKGLTRAIARMSNYRAAGSDHVQVFWVKKVTIHPKLKQHLQECGIARQVPTWMPERRTVLIMKVKSK